MTRETRTWALLVAFSAASTALSASSLTGGLLALPILLLAGLKAHAILSTYLRLFTAPGWLQGFDLGLAVFAILCAGLALAA